MIKRFLKSSVIFFVILGVSFSNVPFYALTGLIDSYEKTSGIVDKIWLVQQNHDSDVVDKFISLRNISDKLKIHEAMAAAPTLMNSSATIGALTTVSVTPVLPAHQIDDILLVSAWIRTTTGSLATPAGWTAINAGGTVRSTVSRYHWFWKRAVSAAETNPVIAVTGGATADKYAKAHVIRGAINAGTPYEASAVTVGTVDPGVATGITTLTDNALVVLVGGSEDNLATQIIVTATNPASLGTSSATSNRYNAVNTGADGASFIAAAERTTAGATGNVSFDFNGVPLGWGAYVLAFKPQPNTTTISNFVSAEPGDSTIAPNTSGMVDSFGLATDSGTDTVTAATVGLAAGMGQYIQTVAITNDGDTVTYCSVAPSGDTASLTSCTVPVTTTNTQFKIKLTAKTHAVMPAPAGGSYGVTATVTGWTGTNTTHAGTDSGSSTLTIDNASPGATTGAGATSGENGQSVVNWTPPGDGDFQQVYIYCKTSSMISGEAPTEGADPAVDGTACDGTARMKYKGTASPQTITSLTNGTLYYFRIYARDTNGNFTAYSATQQVTGTPSAPSSILTVGTSGSQTTPIDSGTTGQALGGAFTFVTDTGSDSVTSIKVTNNGDAGNLSNVKLYYDTSGNGYGGGDDTLFGTGTLGSAISGSMAISTTMKYVYVVADIANTVAGGKTVDLQISNPSTDVATGSTNTDTVAKNITGSTTIRPNVTSITYPDAGQSGGRVGESMTVNGAGFGVACDANNKVTIGAYTLSCTGATFNNTTISIAVDSGIPLTNDGGTGGSGLLVTIGNVADDANQTYYVLPSITNITACSTLPAGNKAREYASGDSACGNGLKDGEVVITGTHFGSAGSVAILTQSATQAIVTGWCGDAAYKADGTCISAQVPATINDSTYTGNVVVTRTAGTKTGTLTGFRVLPRVASLVPSNGIIGTAVTVNGDHLCQAGAASCPVAFGANDKVTFTSAVDATVFTSWSNTAIVTAVPTGAVTGNVVVTSNEPPAYTSNALSFTVDANTTTLATGSDPAVNTIAPSASATDVDLFTLQTNGGTESVTSVTVNLSTNNGVGTLAITDNANTVLGSIGGGTGAGISAGSNVISVFGMSAGTGVATFKVRVTPLSHANMAVPDGGSYNITAPVTSWVGANTHAGSDTNTNALTIDNDSPAGTTGATPTAGDAQVQVSWSNPGDSDFQKVIIYCKTASISETPTEGSDPSVDGTACDGTARVKYSGSTSPQTFTGLSNGTLYYFRIYARDTNGNFTAIASTQQVSATPTLTQTLTVGTVGTQATNLNSGSTAQHIGGAGTAAFTLQINTGSSNVTSVKVSETSAGFAIANLTNAKLYYENAANAASCAYGGAESNVSGAAPVGETITFTLPSVAIGVAANVTCLYFVSDVSSSAVGGQTIGLQIANPSTDVAVSSGVNDDIVAKAIGSTTIRPNVTSITYPDAGQSGGRVGESMTVNGAGFGVACDANNKVTIGAYTLSCTGASFSNTTISIAVDSGIPATNDGGTGGSGLLVTIGNTADDTNQIYYVLPSITNIITCSTLPAGNKAREYAAGDVACGNGLKDGEVIIAGTHFGSAGSVTILTQSATQAIVTGWCGDAAYKADGTCISAQVPATINDSTYTGNVVVTRTAGSKTGTLAGFRVLPRMTSLNPSSASVNDLITVNGNHFCQSGTCPGSFGANDKVTFNLGIDTTYWGAGGWTDTAIDTKVPTGATTGDVVVTSDTPPAYTSNGSTFTLADATPTNPTNEKQARNSGITDLISAGGYASSTPVYFSLDTSSSVSGGTMYAQIELRPTTGVNSSFTSVCTANPYCFETNGGLPYTSGSITVTASTTSITDDVHHWQARVRYNKSGTDYYSGWVPYSDPAFRFDTINPVITFTGADSCATAVDNLGTNGARVSWSFTPPSDVADGQVEYSTDPNLSSSTLFPVSPSAQSSSHAITLFNLNSNTPYYFKVRSRDASGNLGVRPSVSPYCSFTTSSNLSPAKTTSFHIAGQEGSITSGSPLEKTFSVFMPENATTTKGAFVEITGIYEATATGPSVDVRVNGETLKTYTLPYNGNPTKSHFKILHQVSSMIVEIANANTLYVTPGTNTTVYVNSADINVNYSYTP